MYIRNLSFNKFLLKPCALLLSLLPACLLAQQNNYAAFELERENNWDQLITEDLNGDQASDIIVSNYLAGIGRELLIYTQLEDGSFSSNPKRIEIKSEIIAVGFADIRPEPGKELLLFASNAVFSLSSTIDGYAGNIRQLLQWDFIATMPNLEQLIFIENIGDINGDSLVDLLLPGDGVYGYFEGRADEGFELVSEVRPFNNTLAISSRSRDEGQFSGNISINAEQGIQLEFSATTASPYAGFIEQWQDQQADRRSLFRSENWMPSAILSSLNSDQLIDIAYLNTGKDGLGQLNIHHQNEAGFTAEPQWAGSINTRGDVQLVDINQDGISDLLHLNGDGNEWTARFYLNQGGRFDLQQPDQLMRFSGYDVQLNFLKLSDKLDPVLNVSYYTIPVVDAIRNASINRTQLLYRSTEAGNQESSEIFNRRPSSRLDESFSADNVRGLSEQMSLAYDIDGDGIKDALYISDKGTLAAKRIGDDLTIAEQPFWEYISPWAVFEFEVLKLNNDQHPDLILRHGTSSTILVARP